MPSHARRWVAVFGLCSADAQRVADFLRLELRRRIAAGEAA